MIAANAVKELREISGAGMMDCKKALEESKSGFSSSWYNSDTNTSGTVTVISTYYRYNKPCREFIATIHGNKGTQNRYGDACRYGQYNWRLIRF